MNRRSCAVPLALFQQGAVLLLCLMLLAALSVLGLAAASDHVLQVRVSNNLEEEASATRSANASLKWAENWLLGISGDSRPQLCSATCAPSEVVRPPGYHGPAPENHTGEWWKANGNSYGVYPGFIDPVAGAIGNVHENSLWVIEQAHLAVAVTGATPEIAWYRILAAAPVGDTSRYAVTESILARPWGDAAYTDGFATPDSDASFCRELTVPCGRMAWSSLR